MKEKLIENEALFGCKFEFAPTTWMINRGCKSIGQLLFDKHGNVDILDFKPEHIRSIDPSDFVIMKIRRFLLDGVVIPNGMIEDFVYKSYRLKNADVRAKLEWRKENPTTKERPKVLGRSPRNFLWDLICDYKPEEEQCL